MNASIVKIYTMTSKIVTVKKLSYSKNKEISLWGKSVFRFERPFRPLGGGKNNKTTKD